MRVSYNLAFEERAAARFCGVPWHEWLGYHNSVRAEMVAFYRLSSLLEAIAKDRASKRK